MPEQPTREDAEGRIASLVDASDASHAAHVGPAGGDDLDSMPPSGAFDGEDFLFHLYRGSELLQDNCYGEAREELERALNLQPRDVEGQGLLGVVYFRLGLYPRAIQIYEEIIRSCPTEVTPRVNLALCYLKTGQNQPAKEQLEAVITKLPDHVRAWGYLGLVYERIGDLEKALAAFERAGQPHMVRRMRAAVDASQKSPNPAEVAERAELAAAAADAVQEIETEGDSRGFRHAEASKSAGSGRWRAVELGEERLPPPARPFTSQLTGRFGPAVPPVSESMAPASVAIPAPLGAARGPLTPEALVAASALAPHASPAVSIEADGTALVTVAGSFAVRIDALRALAPEASAFKSSSLSRRSRGRDIPEPLGGVATPLVLLEGDGAIVVRQRSLRETDRRLVALWLDSEFLYTREEALVGFDGALRHESGRLPLGSGRQIPMIQLSGRGAVLIEPKTTLRSLGVRAERRVVVRGEDVLGWTGRLLPQPAGPEDAPASSAGFVAFSGDGALLLDPS
jgi:hypothetical protein